MTNSLKSINQDINLKASIMGLANVDDEVKYYTKFLNVRKEIDNFLEKKAIVLENEIKEKQNIVVEQIKDKEKKEKVNRGLCFELNELSIKENEKSDEIKIAKDEILQKFITICQKRKEITKNFDNRAKICLEKEKEIENILKELYLYMNILRLRIINYDDLQRGETIIKGYFVNSNFNLRYFEFDLNDENNTRLKKFADVFLENYYEELDIEKI